MWAREKEGVFVLQLWRPGVRRAEREVVLALERYARGERELARRVEVFLRETERSQSAGVAPLVGISLPPIARRARTNRSANKQAPAIIENHPTPRGAWGRVGLGSTEFTLWKPSERPAYIAMFSGLLNQAANKALAQEDTSEVDGPRRPTLRFEAQAADHKSSSRGGVAKLGLATTQGSVEGIKLYAATHAAKEGAPIAGLIICRR